MPQLPKIDEQNRVKPLSYNPKTGRFITFDEVVGGSARIVPLERLTPEQLKKLVVERQRVGPDYTMSDLNGKQLKRDQIVQEILDETSFGQMIMQAETDYLREFLSQIQTALDT